MIRKGTVKFKNKDKYLDWYKHLSYNAARELDTAIKRTQPGNRRTGASNCAASMLSTWSLSMISHAEQLWEETKEKCLPKLEEFLSFAEEYSIPLKIGEWHEGVFAFLYMGNEEKGILVADPEAFLDFIPDADYSQYTPAQVRSLLIGDSSMTMEIVPTDSGITVHEARNSQQAYADELARTKQKMEDVKNAAYGDLAKLKQEIEEKKAALQAKQDALMAELQIKKEEMELQMEMMGKQIYLLESQIYAIRCFAGETVDFVQLRSGNKAPDHYPVVIHQKLHFMDEDVARIASIYDIQWNELKLFEDLLRYDPTAFETFTPNERCISCVRLSKDGISIGASQSMPFQNLLEKYEYYHGATVGILIRNGENLYLGWTDDSYVHIKEDLIPGTLKYAPEVITEDMHDFDKKRLQEKNKKEAEAIIDGFVSRNFVYNILQGVVEHTNWLPLPSGVTLSRESEYVYYSVADAWLTDNRFGSFTEIIESCNHDVRKGDYVLTVQHLIAEHDWNRRWNDTWNNVRGRGERNRTHDVSTDDCSIYPVNVVEYDDPVPMIRYKYPVSCDPLSGETTGWYEYTTKASQRDHLSDECVILEEFDHADRHVFVSLKKEYSMSGTARANFEIYDNEYINLTFLNSVVLTWAIVTKQLGEWRIKGEKVNYAYAVRYMKKALDHVRKREEAAAELLDKLNPVICATHEWQLVLTEWQKANNVREITAYQARRFAKYWEGR